MLPFFEINPAAARHDLTIFLASSAHHTRKYLLTDAFCDNTECECNAVELYFSDVTDQASTSTVPELLKRMFDDWHAGSHAFKGKIDPDKNTIDLLFPDESKFPRKDRDAVIAAWDGFSRHFALRIQDHRRYFSEWRKEHGWRFQDWTHISPGDEVHWKEVFPTADPFFVNFADRIYAINDGYCSRPKCTCTGVFLHVSEHPDDDDAQPPEIASLLLDLSPKRFSIEKVFKGSLDKLRPVLTMLLATRPALIEELRERKEFMNEFALFVAEQRRTAASKGPKLPPASANRTPRSTPRASASRKKRRTPPADVSTAAAEGAIGIRPASDALGDLHAPTIPGLIGILDSDSGTLRGVPMPQALTPAPAPTFAAIRNPVVRVHRNAPCPCGSGRKYKNCCRP